MKYCTVCYEELDREILPATSDGMLGDVNSDGVVNVKDAVLIYQALVGEDVELNMDAADIDFSGRINALDLTRVLKAIAGWSGYELDGVANGKGSYTSNVPASEIEFGFYLEQVSYNGTELVCDLHFKNAYGEALAGFSLTVESEGGIALEESVMYHDGVCATTEFVSDNPYRMIFVSNSSVTWDTDTVIARLYFNVSDADTAKVTLGLDMNNPPIDSGLNEILAGFFDFSSDLEFVCSHEDTVVTGMVPTCTEDGYEITVCDDCGAELDRVDIPATGHSYDTIVADATCTEDGYVYTYCDDCGDVFEDTVIPALGHEYNTIVADATCTEDGYVYTYCDDCGDVFEDTVIPALGHEYNTVIVDATCTEDGYEIVSCDRYGCDLEEYNVIPAHGHDYRTDSVDPTCTGDGYIYTYCDDCGYVSEDTVILATGHDYNITVIDATCTVDGYKIVACHNCDYERFDEVYPATGHVNTETVSVKEATCTKSGYTGNEYCNDCNTVISYGEVIPKKGHVRGDWVVISEATETEDGISAIYCTECGVELVTAVFPKLGSDEIIPGDANGDGKVNLADVSLILKLVAMWDVEINEDAADVNGDGRIRLDDATLIMKYVSGWDVVLG